MSAINSIGVKVKAVNTLLKTFSFLKFIFFQDSSHVWYTCEVSFIGHVMISSLLLSYRVRKQIQWYCFKPQSFTGYKTDMTVTPALLPLEKNNIMNNLDKLWHSDAKMLSTNTCSYILSKYVKNWKLIFWPKLSQSGAIEFKS